MGLGVVKKLTGGAVGALGAARAVTGHVAWYLRHQMIGAPRDDREA